MEVHDKKFLVYRSSAGSGKTFTLVKEYLSIVLKEESPYSFRYILAVTFTNKAANEMKERVLSSLNAFANNEILSSGEKTMMSILQHELFVGEEFIREKSKNVITAILHNYGDFNITTIDKFMLRVVRAFAHELKLPVNFEVELDEESLISRAVDGLIAKVGEDPELTAALLKYSKFQAEEEKSWNIEKELKEVAPQLLKEQGYRHIQKLRNFDLAHFVELNKEYSEKIKVYENKLKNLATKALQLIHQQGLNGEEFYKGKNGLYSVFKKASTNSFDKLKNNASFAAVQEDKWYAGKTSKEDSAKIDAIKLDLKKIVDEISTIVSEEQKDYELNLLISQNLYAVALLNEIEKIIENLRAENNSVHISEFNKRILDIVLTQPIPFVYERIGEKYKHYLIDEFQDTSVLQWQNLLPLIDNALASGNKNLVVGDAKQAIYRWRGGDVEQFANIGSTAIASNSNVQERLESINRNFEEKILSQNFRSTKNVIAFNNLFFEKILDILPPQLKEFYKDYFQEDEYAKDGGYVRLTKLEEKSDEYTERTLQEIKLIVHDAVSRGYLYSDIAVLSRRNENGNIVADFLTENNIPVVSSESLLLHKNKQVQLIIALLELSFNPQNKPALIKAISILHSIGFIKGELHVEFEKQSKSPQLFFNLLQENGIDLKHFQFLSLPEIVQLWVNKLQLNNNDPYLVQLFDCANQYAIQNGPDTGRFLEWWQEKGEKLSVQMSDDENAVKISSIHKSKGLEFPIVILPFTDTKIYRTENIWLDQESEALPSAYVKAKKSLEETDFSGTFTDEQNKMLLDQINVMYVAMTRAKNEMYIFSKPGKNSASPQNTADLLELCFQENPAAIFELGKRSLRAKSTALASEKITPSSHVSNSWREHIMISRQAPTLWDAVSPKEYGNVIHSIFAKMDYETQLQTVLNEAMADGLIDDSKGAELATKIRSLLNHPQIKPLFEEGAIIKKEQEIITDQGEIIRPDRVVELKNGISLLDFKTGEGNESHHKQIKKYAFHLSKITSKPIKCYLLYIENNEVVEVN
ncbi:MAG: UvrD-helicase domain-containing protein [Bacteroidetes bacterium]|nr:UvrD-helicase domain-containing protein [Bacteroidota bacterium]